MPLIQRIYPKYRRVFAGTFPLQTMDVNSPARVERRPKRPPTILDIAKAAAVSKTTVSRVLNGSARVAPDTRTRVRDAIAQLGFQVNLAARSLRTSRTGLVG